MKVLAIIKKNNGPCFHRIMMPMLMMDGVDTRITNNCTAELFEQGFDTLFYSRDISDDVLDIARKNKMNIVVDVDDYWYLDRHHISYNVAGETNWGKRQEARIGWADLVTTTHERLAEKIYPFNNNVIVLPNAIPNHQFFDVEKTGSSIPRIFWQGSITHEKDLVILKNPFKRLSKCATIIAGYTEHPAWDTMVNAFTNGLGLKGMVLPGLPPQEYYSNYAHADICVAPLIKSVFNSMKTNLKVLEAAYSALPIVCSEVDPYLDLPVLYANKQGDWFKHLNALIHDKDMRIELGQQLKDYCDQEYNFKTINQKRYEAFNGLATGVHRTQPTALRYAY